MKAEPIQNRVVRFLRSCISSPLNALLTAALVALVIWALPDLFRWLVADAVWSGTSGRDCAGHDGACWIFIQARTDQLLYGSYPVSERWRLAIAALVGIGVIATVAGFYRRMRVSTSALMLIAAAIVIGTLMVGGVLGLRYVSTTLWGGVLLTIIIASWTIATALPVGLMLALARRSELPVISAIAATFIDLVRSMPLLGLLFLMIVMFPLFVPPGFETDKLMRALIAFTIFNAASFAEVFRGGLQSVPDNQIEGGLSLGLRRWRVMASIVVPQAIAVSVPALVNICIAIVKETTIVLILGLFDFIGVLQAGTADPEWLMAESVRTTAYVFAALVYWGICFALSRYSLALERGLPAAAQARQNAANGVNFRRLPRL
jgi:general L-amino acid transport system permease protein